MSSSPSGQPQQASAFVGFDGVGGSESDYTSAKILEISLDHLGGLVLLSIPAHSSPFPLPVGINEAAQLFHAAPGIAFRRPTTALTWKRTLEATGATVKRIVLNRQVGSTYYARIILQLPKNAEAMWRTIDARPADAIAVALQTDAPLYISKRLVQGRRLNGGSREEDTKPPVARMPPPAALHAELEGGGEV